MSWFSSTQSRFFLVFMSRTQYSVFWFSSPQCFLFKAGLLICFYVMYTVSFDSVVHSVCWYVFMSRTRCLSIQLYTVSVNMFSCHVLDMFSCHMNGVFWFSTVPFDLFACHVRGGLRSEPRILKNYRPGRMTETPRAGTGDSVCRSWCYWCSTMLMWGWVLLIFAWLVVD